ncbi:hypothetical protein V494_04201 [Pseudogymnoascus sp. VKM F-4513 (FW-928)]|nr:hypothetical protein V494_04201 [Pseudogymnoascus sp. VKM F-4513 (FW-928)]
MPPRPQGYGSPATSSQQNRQNLYNQAQPLPQHFSAPHSRPTPVQRPVSANSAQTGPFSSQTLNNWWSGPNAPAPPKSKRSTSGTSHPQSHGSSSAGVSRLLGIGVEGEGGRQKVKKKRSVYF